MTTLKNILATAIVAIGMALLSGCQSIPLDGTGKNIGVYNYGEFQGLYNTTAPTVAKATRDAVKQLGLIEVAANDDKFDSVIIARDAEDLKVQIKVEEANSLQTRISIRWGSGGDRNKSIQLYQAVESILTGNGSMRK